MARKLTFQHGARFFECTVTKVARDRLYGRKETSAVDARGRMLHKGYLDEWGSVVIASTGMGYLDADRRWHAKSELTAVDAAGRPLPLIPSSFDAPIVLDAVVDLADFMEHETAMVYVLHGYENPDLIALLKQAAGLYTFPFCYREAYDTRPAFLQWVDDALFLIVAQPTDLPFLTKPQRSMLDADDEDGDEEEADDLDFSNMM